MKLWWKGVGMACPGDVHGNLVMAWQVSDQSLILWATWQEATTWMTQTLDQTGSSLDDGGSLLTSVWLLFGQL